MNSHQIDWFTETVLLAEYLKLPLILPYLQPGNHQFIDGVNFASGGAGALVETHEGNEGRV